MARSWQAFDISFPSFSGKETEKQKVEKLHNYLFQLKQGLQFVLQSMDTEIEKVSSENETLKQKMEKLEERLAMLE